MVDLAGRKCVVVGAGKIAADKISGLLQYGPEITVVAPRVIPDIRAKARKGLLILHEREFSPRDLNGAFLAIAATDSPAANHSVFRACKAREILCNAVDDPENCDFFYPAIVRRGALQIAISTNGQSPALASRLRKELEEQFGSEWEAWIDEIGRIRRELLAAPMPAAKRRQLLMEMASPQAFQSFQAKKNSPKPR